MTNNLPMLRSTQVTGWGKVFRAILTKFQTTKRTGGPNQWSCCVLEIGYSESYTVKQDSNIDKCIGFSSVALNHYIIN